MQNMETVLPLFSELRLCWLLRETKGTSLPLRGAPIPAETNSHRRTPNEEKVTPNEF